MTDLNNEREEFESDLADHLIERDANGFYINYEIQHYWDKHLLKAQVKELKAWLEKAKAQAVPEGYVLISEEAVEKKDRRIEELEYSLKAIYHRAESTYCSACRFAEAEAADVGCGTKTSESGAEG